MRDRQLQDVDMSLAGVGSNGPGSEVEQVQAALRGRWREAARAVMIVLSAHGLPPAQIAELLGCHPARCGAGSAGSAARGRRGWPQLSARTLYRRVRLVAVWRRPELTARDDPDRDHVVAQIAARLMQTAPPGGGAGRGRDAPEPAAACAGQLDAARRPAAGPHAGHEPQGHRVPPDY